MEGNSTARIETTSENCVYQNKYLSLYDDDVVFPRGNVGKYVRVNWQAFYSVGVLPVDSDGNYVLIRQYCYAIADWNVQIVKGMGDAEHTPEQMALRELEEETGLTCDSLIFLKTLYVDPGFIVNPLHVFLAPNAKPVGAVRLEETEVIAGTVLIPRRPSIARSLPASITDAATLCAIFLSEVQLGGIQRE